MHGLVEWDFAMAPPAKHAADCAKTFAFLVIIHAFPLPNTYTLGFTPLINHFFFFLFRHTSIHLQIYICLYIEGECIKQFHFSIPRNARQCLLSLNLKTKNQILAYDMKLTCHQIHGITTT